MAVDPRASSTVYGIPWEVGTVVRSTDGGQHWQTLYSPTSLPGVIRLALDPLNPQTMVAAGPNLVLSHDGGATWTQVAKLPGRNVNEVTNSIVVLPGGRTMLVFLVGGELWRSEDGGTT
jgi:photosystem II stability/assembly factor-like uncharacterized protein